MSLLRRILASLTLSAACLSAPAFAEVELRVEARPVSAPIEAFIKVTSITGDPVTGLAPDDFVVVLDGNVVPTQDMTLSLPPAEDPDSQKVSVVFAMDYTTSVTNQHLETMEAAVAAFVDAMRAGDFAAIVKFNADSGVTAVQAFIEIDDGGPNDVALHAAIVADYPGDGSNILDATAVAIQQFAAHPNPLVSGPKAVILVTDGEENSSEDFDLDGVIGLANESSIPVFTIGVPNSGAGGQNLMEQLAADTGGLFILAPTDEEIADAYMTLSSLLANEYLLTIPSSIDDCLEHTLSVVVDPHGTDSATFTRRECDRMPDAFDFEDQTGLDPDVQARSNAVTITGVEVPVQIRVSGGSYSIGCGDGTTFTNVVGTIEDGDTVCVRHSTSTEFSTSKTTTLTVGGASATFTTTTRAQGGGGGGGGGGGNGGGGATGVLELLLGLALLRFRSRRSR